MEAQNALKTEQTRRLVLEIHANVDGFYANEISFEDYKANQRILWARAEREGVATAVTQTIAGVK